MPAHKGPAPKSRLGELYHVEFASPRVPAIKFRALDLVQLGEHIAVHLTRHKALRPGRYDAEVGDDRGAIHQTGLQRPVTFSIRKES